MTTIRVLIVDDHPVVRDGLRGILAADPSFEVVGEAGDGAEALVAAAHCQPDVVLMDLRMPGLGGADAIRRLRAEQPNVGILVLTTFDLDRDVLTAIEAGATGYLLKDVSRVDLLRAVRAAARGESVLAPAVATRLVNQIRSPAHDTLSQRELEVLGLIARGLSNREAAAQLFISEATVKTHLLHIYAKLGASHRTAAVTIALERGLIPGP